MPNPKTAHPWWRRPQKRLLVVGACVVAVLIIFHFWLHITNPYAGWSIVQQPYTTSVNAGKINAHKQFSLHVYSSPPAELLGYYKSGFLIVQNTFFGSRPSHSTSVDGIIQDIHRLRFDPSKPYLISGDQFSVLYPRNLGVFYNDILNPHTAHDKQDWENRQRIYLQSALYALDAFSAEKRLTTTIVPIAPHSVVLTEVHPGSVPSDSLYGILYALDALQDAPTHSDDTYKLETVDAARTIIRDRRADLQLLLGRYLSQVQDPSTGLVKSGVHLASARDGVVRDRSFYDNVVLWKTLQLADKLDIQKAPDGQLEKMHDTILDLYWDDREGHFKDDMSTRTANANYSSDWLLALPTGFLRADNPADREYLKRSIDFIRAQHIADPFPIKYQAATDAQQAPWAVRTFVPNYGSDAIWSYWGAQYMTLLGQLAHDVPGAGYQQELQRDIEIYSDKIRTYRGFPETFTPDGRFLQTLVYKSIRQTGWVVQFESARQQEVDLTK
jgi:hypothetical protein